MENSEVEQNNLSKIKSKYYLANKFSSIEKM